MNVLVMGGMGQVGQAICGILKDHKHDVFVLDKKGEFEPSESLKYDFLHVCIPHGEYFLENVRKAVRKYQPQYVIVHSTVPVGTTRKIGWFAAHSPVRGQHPNLKEGIQKFVKYMGASSVKTRVECSWHLKSLGLNVEVWNHSNDTELMKLLCLSRYLNDLAFYETAFKACKKFKVGPVRMLQWTYTYNDGYKETKYVRPELSFPMGKVGGHCVMPVSRMLSGQTGYKFFRKNLDVFDEKASGAKA